MKSKKRRILFILIIIAIIVLIVLWFAKKENHKEEETNTVTENFIQLKEDGTVENISSKLKEEKELDGLRFKNIRLIEKSGQLTLFADVMNTTNQDIEAFLVNIILYDKEGKELGTILSLISPIKAGETVELKTGITEKKYINAYDFKIVKK